MKVKISEFLVNQKPNLKLLVDKLSTRFEYASILASDTNGKNYGVKKTATTLSDSTWSERGFVARVYNGVNYSEYSFNQIGENEIESIFNKITEIAQNDVESLKKDSIAFNSYPLMDENDIKDSFISEVNTLPEEVSIKEKLEKMSSVMAEGLSLSEELVDFRIAYEEVHVNKMFLSTKKDLEQSYIWTTAALIPIAIRDGNMKYTFSTVSGLKGVEILDELPPLLKPSVNEVVELLGADRAVPGDYDIICDPDMAGLIAHEAFGHGVEMDMFVKNRAKAPEFLDKFVASEKVRMHDGARSAYEISSYLFDDEGTLGTDTLIIENGILKNGISDILSALKLGTTPTGNGKRESFERKAYARMTNTFFAPGEDKLEDMIKSIDKGYLLEGFQSGMEDPKNWGIQCVALKGKEIIDGKLTGKIIAPVFLTGYVPDLLKSIDMVSSDLKLSGSGACGKGHKEWVKTSTGGPYIKTRGRIG